MGLMQIMPATWREMRAELSLDGDPFDPRANVLAGSAYLRRLYDRYGAPGFLAAYSAGPGRYDRYLAGYAPLPLETRRYVARLAPCLTERSGLSRQGQARDWRSSSLFIGVGRDLSRLERRP